MFKPRFEIKTDLQIERTYDIVKGDSFLETIRLTWYVVILFILGIRIKSRDGFAYLVAYTGIGERALKRIQFNEMLGEL